MEIRRHNSGRVIMDNLMMLVTTALEWSYAKAREGCESEDCPHRAAE
jgi:hypothetical protein